MLIYLAMLETEQERQSFADIYNSYHHTCFYVALKVTGNRQTAEDAVHNAFLEIIKRKEEIFQIPCSKLKSRIVIITKNKAIDLLRKDKKLSPFDDSIEEIPADEPDLSTALAGEEGYHRLVCRIGELPETYKTVFELRYFHDMEYLQIAREIGISVSNVSVRLARGKKLLGEMLREEGDFSEPV